MSTNGVRNGPFSLHQVGMESEPLLQPAPDHDRQTSDVPSSDSLRRRFVAHRTKPVVPRRCGTWRIITSSGDARTSTADKRTLVWQEKLRIPLRDMRIMDPELLASESGHLLVRENAIVLCLEHVRAIITADKVLIPLHADTSEPAREFVQKLESNLLKSYWEGHGIDISQSSGERKGDASPTRSDAGLAFETVPFEFVALEFALKEVCSALAEDVQSLCSVGHFAVEALVRKVTKTTLERVRKVKMGHQRLFERVKNTREELERYLDDDHDMWRMCLTKRKKIEADPALASLLSFGMPQQGMPQFSTTPWLRQGSPKPPAPMSNPCDALGAEDDEVRQLQRCGSNNEDNMLVQLYNDVEDVENLLEAYFVQIESSYNKLIALDEFIKDTEEFINIELDVSRNRLIKLDITLTIAMLALAIFNLVAGILGENVVIPKFLRRDVMGFWMLNGTVLLFALSCFTALVLYMRTRRLV